MEIEMPTVETIRRLVQSNEGVAFLPRMCVGQEIRQRTLCEVRVEEIFVQRPILLIYPENRTLSQASKAFLELVSEF
jgi:DNA-binding transcriptional LysR family regulator